MQGSRAEVQDRRGPGCEGGECEVVGVAVLGGRLAGWLVGWLSGWQIQDACWDAGLPAARVQIAVVVGLPEDRGAAGMQDCRGSGAQGWSVLGRLDGLGWLVGWPGLAGLAGYLAGRHNDWLAGRLLRGLQAKKTHPYGM